MLRELHISNLAVIEDVTVSLSEGLNCFTGQTGAGKSLVLGAFEILLGLRAGGDMLRPGATEARVAGVFELHDQTITQQIAALLDTELPAGEPLLITRRVFATGRSSVSVNGQPVTAAMIKQVGELLVDVHGQHDHQYLLKPSNQLSILDDFSRSGPVRERYAQTYAQLRELRQRRQELDSSRSLRRQQLELYEFQEQELARADLAAGEFQENKQRHAKLSNISKIKQQAGQAHAALYDSEGSVVERAQMIAHVLVDMGHHDKELAQIAEQIRTATLTLQENAYELGRYVDRLDLSPRELSECEERLNVLNRLIAKYAGQTASRSDDPVADLMLHHDELLKKIAALRGQDEDLSQIDTQAVALRRSLESLGKELGDARRAGAAKLKPLVEAELRDLGMAGAEFEVSFEPVALEQAITQQGGAEVGVGSAASGLEIIEMMVRTNPGQPSRPLRKIASGGELSRIMLALKSILASSDRVSVLVFDEIDANIGGRMATVIGSKLRSLAHATSSDSGDAAGATKKSKKPATKRAATGRHQVVCITHLPQIAAFADRHVRIAKEVVPGKGKEKLTRTTVTPLEGDARIEELAEMLAGKDVTDTTRKQVREMIDAAGA
jgi:DNA repair protein RecN (Recombination protein N)